MENKIQFRIQEQLERFNNLIHDVILDVNEKKQGLDDANAALAELYNQKYADEGVQTSDKGNIIGLTKQQVEFYKKNNLKIDNNVKFMFDSLLLDILVDDDYIILDLMNTCDEIFDRYESIVCNDKRLMKIAAERYPNNRNFKAHYDRLFPQQDS